MLGTVRSLWLLALKETQTIVTGLTVIAILRLRNAHSVYIGAGATFAAVTAKILKRFIRQPRPELSTKTTYGMPSTHSSSIAFFGTYLSLCIWNLRPHPRFLPHLLSRQGDSGDFSPLVRLILTGTVLFGAASVCWSRVRLTYHTRAQVIAGASVGSFIAIGCFVLWETKCRAYAKWAEGIVESLLMDGYSSLKRRDMAPLRDNVSSLQSQWSAYSQRDQAQQQQQQQLRQRPHSAGQL